MVEINQKQEIENLTLDEILERLQSEAEEYKDLIKNTDQKMNQRLDDFKKRMDLIKKYKDKKTLTLEEKQEILKSFLCYGDLAFCCSTSKVCDSRNIAMELIHLSEKEYQDEKIKFGTRLIS